MAPGLLRFIVARFFYSDPVNTTIAVMSAFAVYAVGFTEAQALQVLLVLTVVAVVASFGWGFLADRWGPRRTLFTVLAAWAVALAILSLFLSTIPFLVAGALAGAGLGGVGVVDRLMLLRLTPPDRVGEMFGLYGLVGKFSAVVGPIVYGIIVASLLDGLGRGAYQVAVGSLLVLLLLGIWILRGVPEGEATNEEAAADVLLEESIR
jgi:UMF1 family MFS transporter